MKTSSHLFKKFAVIFAVACVLSACAKKAQTPEDAILMLAYAGCDNDDAAIEKLFEGPSGMAKFMATQICKEKGRAESFEVTNQTTEGDLTVISGRFHFKNGKSGVFKFKLKETPDGWKHRSR